MRKKIRTRKKQIFALFLALMFLACSFTVSAAGNGTETDGSAAEENTVSLPGAEDEDTDSQISGVSGDIQTAGEENTEEKTEEPAEDNGDSEIVSVLNVDTLAEGTVLSSDEAAGIAQLAGIIPDINLRTEVWRSLNVAGQLGNPEDSQYAGLEGDELYKAVLRNFTGTVYASGYVKEMLYTYSFRYILAGRELTFSFAATFPEAPLFTSREEAVANMENIISEGSYNVVEGSQEVAGSVTVTDERKPYDQLIRDITGVEYLQKAGRIDLSYNMITSLLPLDRKTIADRFYGGDENAARFWFGDYGRMTDFTFVGNPIQKFPQYMPGRMRIDPLFNEVPVGFEQNPVILIKKPGEALKDTLEIDMPAVTIESNLILYDKSSLKVNPGTCGDNIKAEYIVPESSGDEKVIGKIEVTGVSGSGNATFSIGTKTQDGETNELVQWNGVDYNDSPASVGCGITVELNQPVRVLYAVLPGDVTTSVELEFNKYELGTDHPVAGASYRLFRMETGENGPVYSEDDEVTIREEDGYAVNQAGEVIAVPVNSDGIQNEYVTDDNGAFTFSAELEEGTYCFIETESPDAYEVNTTPVIFTVGASDTAEINGGTRMARVELYGLSSGSDTENIYQLYTNVLSENGDYGWQLYNNDNELGFSADQDGKIVIEGLVDGSYQLRPALSDTDDSVVDFEVADGKAAVTKGENISAESEAGTFIDRYSDPISITLPQPAEDQELDSLVIQWYKADDSGTEQQIFRVGEDFTVGDTTYSNATADDVVKAAQDFININKGSEDASGFIQGQVTVSPVYKYKPAGPLQAEDPAKVQFSFVKTDGDPGEGTYSGLAGAEFTLYKADENWQWSADDVYKTAVSEEETGLVSFGYLDSGSYIMKETKPPRGYAALPGYWKITADAWAEEENSRLSITYVREDGEETEVSEDSVIPADIYGNQYYIPNYPVDTLPAMGGNGTRTFTVTGLILTGTALILFTRARRYKK